jgi:hypothetical protein
MTRGRLAALGLVACLAWSGGCATRTRHAAANPRVDDRAIVLNGHALRLHFANQSADGARPLLVYATGDGGWHRKDLAAYRHPSLEGSIVGFDAHDRHAPERRRRRPQGRLAADYGQIIQAARAALHLRPDRPVVLVGVSRGAGLSVVAAGQCRLRPSISGVVAVALTREEEYVKWFRRLPGRGQQPARR